MNLVTPNGYKFTVDDSYTIVMEMYVIGFSIEMTSRLDGNMWYSKIENTNHRRQPNCLHEIMLPMELAGTIDKIMRHEITVARALLSTLTTEREEYKNHYGK